MSEQVTNEFPFKFQSLDPKERAEIKKNFDLYFEMCRIGPKGYILSADYEADAGNIYNMPIKSDDVFVCSYPRSGTTWTQELVWLLVKDLDYTKARSTPLTRRYTYLEFSSLFTKDYIDKIYISNSEDVDKNLEHLKEFNKPGSEILATCPSPRFIKTHLPLSFLPPTAIDTAKMVYVARDPRDVAVSFYHQNIFFNFIKFKGDFKTYWNLFTKNLIFWSPFFEHLKEAWLLRDHPNMLLLFYEELSKDLSAAVHRVADFLGKQLSEEQVSGLCDHLSFENFKKNGSVNLSEITHFGITNADESFIRKGKAGGWRDYFDEEMCEEAERWIAHNLRDTDLRFPYLKTTIRL